MPVRGSYAPGGCASPERGDSGRYVHPRLHPAVPQARIPPKTGKDLPASVPLRGGPQQRRRDRLPARYISRHVVDGRPPPREASRGTRAHDRSASERGPREPPPPTGLPRRTKPSPSSRGSATAHERPSSQSGRSIGRRGRRACAPCRRPPGRKSAPGRSSLLTNASRGMPCGRPAPDDLRLRLHAPTPQNTATAPSSTRSDRSTSMVKSTCPGVSIRWTSAPSHEKCVAAAVIVIPRSLSCGR